MSRARDLANLGNGIDATQITSGVFANGRIQTSNVTQHLTIQSYSKTSGLSNHWTALNLHDTPSEQGVHVYRYGKLYIVYISAYAANSTDYQNQATSVITTVANSDITFPSATINMGVGFYAQGQQNDKTAQVVYGTNGEITLYTNSGDDSFAHVVDQFVGVDTG